MSPQKTDITWADHTLSSRKLFPITSTGHLLNGINTKILFAFSVSSQANEQSMCSSCVNYNFFFYFKYRKCEQNINLIVNSMISDWECLEILMHSMKDPQWVKYLPFKNDLYGAVFQVLIWKYRERLLVNSSQTGRGL